MEEKLNITHENLISNEDFIEFLDKRMLGNIGEGPWKSLTICHGEECFEHYGVTTYQQIRRKFESVKNLAGVYAYFIKNQKTECIYIGVSKNLSERIYQHLLESCNAWGHPRYKEAFKNYRGEVDFYYLPLGDQSKDCDYLRSIVEKILQVKYKPILHSIKL
ncbi:GIY-YIG nuclease family protein [Pedobacter sp. KBW01]|uniref:GIY-YIG nuclease family protein n=1 Tax=Pedobacter sp. KBW01 TaxID=2153364 RepID=UPI001319C2C6|nr:GIY-YIG nuclease family protein [Pedobacter sp. KBW01]